MKAEFDIVIFDLDGTLIDTIGDLGAAVDHSMKVHGYPTHSLDEYRMMVGHGVRNLVERALPAGEEAAVDDCLACFLDYYCSHIAVHTRPYEGVSGVLGKLSAAGVRLAVASNKFQQGTETLVRTFFPEIDFCAILGGREGVPLKPDPTAVKSVIADCGIPSPRVAMVGDSSTDIKTALAAGIVPIGVTWGFRDEEELRSSGAKLIAHNPDELGAILLR